MRETPPPILPGHPMRRSKRGVWQVEVDCPYCGTVHRHGGGDAEQPDFEGHRIAHCRNLPEGDALPGYILKAWDDVPDREEQYEYGRQLLRDERNRRARARLYERAEVEMSEGDDAAADLAWAAEKIRDLEREVERLTLLNSGNLRAAAKQESNDAIRDAYARRSRRRGTRGGRR